MPETVQAIYFIDDNYLGYEDLPETEQHSFSRSILCNSCGNVYAKKVITVDGKANSYTPLGGLCKTCSPESRIDPISGGFPFFYQIKDPPFDLLKHQLEMELQDYDRRNP